MDCLQQFCGKVVDHTDCHDWLQIPCEENFCKSELLLRNITEEYSGLYKCTSIPLERKSGQVLDVQLVRTYQLDVKSKYCIYTRIRMYECIFV